MTSPSVVVKSTVKAILKGNYYKSICACLICIFIALSIQLTASLIGLAFGNAVLYILLSLLYFFLLFPTALGLLRFFRHLMWDKNDDIISVFYYFGNIELYKKAISSVFSLILRLFLIGLAVYLPSILLTILGMPQIYEFLGVTMPAFIRSIVETTSVFTVISTVIYLILAVRYYMTPFLLVADEEMDAGEALHMSKVISKRSSWDFVGLVLSLSFWILISLFIIPLPFTMPYIALAYMVHCRFAVAHYNKIADLVNQNNIPFYSSDI